MKIFSFNHQQKADTNTPGYQQLANAPQQKAKTNLQILKTGFTSLWSIEHPNSVTPESRSGSFSVFSPDKRIMYIGYGSKDDSKYFNDIWSYNFENKSWKELKISGYIPAPRTGTRGVLISNWLVLFGGYANSVYFADLHRVNILTGECFRVEAKVGVPPSPRSTPIVGVWNRRFFVWGGYNGEWPNELNVYDFDGFSWKQIPQTVAGRTSAPSAQVGKKIYSFGGTKTASLLIIDLETCTIQVEKTTGVEPPSSVISAGLVLADNYLFFIGGKGQSNFMFIFCLDISRLKWFVFHVQPDNKTTTVKDGSISDFGLFMLPTMYHFCSVYDEKTRKINIALGQPIVNPPSMHQIYIGDALSVLHHRDDMLSMLYFNPGHNNTDVKV